MASFLSSPSYGSLPSDEAYLHVPVTKPQRLTSEAHMSEPRWRETRPSRPYGGEPGARPPGRAPGPPPDAPGGRGGVVPPGAGTAPGGRGGVVPPGAGTAPGGRGGVVPPGAGRAVRREAGHGVVGPRDPGWDGRAAGGRGGTGPTGRGGSTRGAGDGPPTRQLPAQPLTAPPDATQPARTR